VTAALFSLQEVPEVGAGEIASGDHPSFKKHLLKIPGTGKCKFVRHRIEFVNEMDQYFHPRRQEQDPADLLLRLEGSPDSVVLSVTLETALILECKPGRLLPNPTRVRTPIDNFILEKLEKAGLHFSPEADRATLIRRVTLDLIGLLPTPEETLAFVKDTSPNAYEHLVDGLLARPTFGEQRARYWLDYARYADTYGLHYDNSRDIWPYRDYVIRSTATATT
jgi:hypothetical protein